MARFGQDIKVPALIYAALCDALLGNVDEALMLGEEAIAHARNLNHANTLVYALWHVGVWLASIVRDAETVRRCGAEMLELTHTYRLVFWEVMGSLHFAINRHGKTTAEAIADAERAMGVWGSKYGGRIFVPDILCRVAEAFLDENDVARAEHALTESETMMISSGELYWQPEFYRLRGRLEAIRTPDQPQAAIDEYERAIAIARERNARLLELRAATGLARLLAEHDGHKRARDVLLPIYEWFSGGFDKPDLVDARAVLNTLG